MNSWIVVALVAGIASNLGAFSFRYILKDRGDSSAYAWFFELMRLVAFSVVAVFNFKLDVTAHALLSLVTLGLVEFVAIFLTMKMHAHSHLSVSTIILRTRLVWIPIIAFLLFREVLAPVEYAGILVLFAGLCIATAPKKLFTDKGIKYAYLAAFATALVSIGLKEVAAISSTPVAMIFMALPSVVLFPLVMKDAQKRIRKTFKTGLGVKLLSGLVNAASVYLLARAISLGPVSKVTAVYQGTMVVSILAGIIFLKERQDIGRKLVGTAVTMVGVVLLTSF